MTEKELKRLCEQDNITSRAQFGFKKYKGTAPLILKMIDLWM